MGRRGREMSRAFDHLVLCVNDLEAARAGYQRLGFTLTPRAEHPFGTANSLVQLDGNFLELLAVSDPAKVPPARPGHFSFGAFNRDFLTRGEGFSMLVLQTADARRDQAAFAASGLETYAPFDFSRAARLPDGREVTVGFSLAFVTEPRMPEAAFFVCQQHNPEYFWNPAYQRHANGARTISAVVMAADEPGRFRDFFGKLLAPAATREEAGGFVFETGGGRLELVAPRRLAERLPGRAVAGPTPRLVGYTVAVEELVATRALLEQNGVPFRSSDARLVVPPSHAFGVAIAFESAP